MKISVKSTCFCSGSWPPLRQGFGHFISLLRQLAQPSSQDLLLERLGRNQTRFFTPSGNSQTLSMITIKQIPEGWLTPVLEARTSTKGKLLSSVRVSPDSLLPNSGWVSIVKGRSVWSLGLIRPQSICKNKMKKTFLKGILPCEVLVPSKGPRKVSFR